ncbi:hypothetical protein [Kitasatospora sp. NBC_00315]|uniref:hypothetical protein n=1 Tax=Kitasatospora sp. NBC_00315 TaxID=2975963 RepID=UPI003246C464
MSSRRVLWAVAAAAAALTLTACNNDTDNAGPATAGTQAAPAPAATDAGAAPETAATTAPAPAPAPASSKPATGGASGAATPTGVQKDGCGATGKPLAAGHRNILPTTRTTATAISAKDALLECTQPDFGWWPNGAEKSYTFAAGAKAEVAVDLQPQAISLAKLTERIVRCADDTADHLGCGSGAYQITLDAGGKITAIREYADF